MKKDQLVTMEFIKDAFSLFNETSEKLEQAYHKLESRASELCSGMNEKETREREIRLQAMGWMVTKIVHDIRNPLGSIELISSLLQKELTGDQDKQELLGHIIYGVKNIDTVLSNLLHFTSFPRPRFEPVNLRMIIDSSLEVVSYLINKKDINVVRDVAEDIDIYCDKALMRQVFLNLFLNSLQAMSEHGDLTIEVIQNRDNGEVDISVQDTGCGIDPENIGKIFDPFFTTNEKGPGLGLTIVHNIISAHNGTINAYSKSGEGSLFVINLSSHGG